VLDGCVWLAQCPSLFTCGKDPVLIVQEVGWVSGPFWMGAENVASTEVWKPNQG